jgi:tetratricopeptide (TPR) repeat protein
VVLDPRRPGAWGRLARATARLGETERAGAQLRRALLLAPADAEAAGDQARLTDSATAYRRWAWIDPRDDEAVTGLAEILAETGDHDGAARTLSGFAKRTEVPDLALRVGRRAGAGWARARRTRYEQWRAEYDRDDSSVLADIASRWISPPTISVMLPVCDPSPLILEEAIASVERQSYAHWQLCVADDASRDPEVQKVLAAAETRDPRISVVWRPQRGHISAATNSALAGATGEWVTFLDHDDCLHIHALHHVAATIVAATIVADPTLDLIYSDEDKIDEAGSHFEPHFKPDWDPDRLLAQNYICHLAVYRRALVEAVGGCE